MEQDGPLPDKGPSPHPTMPEIFITTSGISKLLQNLNIHKAMCPDQINAKILRELQDILAPILEIIFNHSLITGMVPSDWKMANITPFFKKGERSQPNNYRPISLTSIVSKLFEHTVNNKSSTVQNFRVFRGFSIKRESFPTNFGLWYFLNTFVRKRRHVARNYSRSHSYSIRISWIVFLSLTSQLFAYLWSPASL